MLPIGIGHLEKDEKNKEILKKYVSLIPKPKEVFFCYK